MKSLKKDEDGVKRLSGIFAGVVSVVNLHNAVILFPVSHTETLWVDICLT